MTRLIDADALLYVFMGMLDEEQHAEFLYTDEICKGFENAPTVDAVPIEFIQKEIEELEESLDYYGSIDEFDALRIDAMYQHDALTGLLRHWKAERKDNE